MTAASRADLPGVDFLEEPTFPPLLTGYAVKGDVAPLVAALEAIARGDAGAGDFFWSRLFETARCAIVLEPETDAGSSLVMVPLAMVALGDALGAIGPPNLAITFAWPNQILANGALVGTVTMDFPDITEADEHPDFAVLTLDLALNWQADNETASAPGTDLRHTVLHEEGCGDLDRTVIVEAFARHLLSWIDSWEQDGFKAVHAAWLFKAHEREKEMSVVTDTGVKKGRMTGLDELGGLLLKDADEMLLIPLSSVLLCPNRLTGPAGK